ncbi:MAG: carbohydrate ABC transporter permease [Defluviitaleaceae bacterium]|nr:carbohydrate ABC transporter permease [Defluviitaleaceae bacterium]
MKTFPWLKILQYSILLLVAAFMMFPVFWIFSNSLRTLPGISHFPPRLFPETPQFSNYVYVLRNSNFLLYFRNTMILIVANTVGTLISSSMVAYPLAQMEFRGRKFFFALILATMMVPAVTTIIPQFIIFRELGWLDSLWPMIVPGFFAFPYNVFLFRQFFMTIPKSLGEAAKIDGCNQWQVFSIVVVPLAKPVFITIGVLSAIWWWNELFQPLIYVQANHLRPLTTGALAGFRVHGSPHMVQWNLQMAMAMLMIIPPMILYLVASRYIVQGIKATGLKE